MKKLFEKTLKKLKGEESVVVECSTYDETILFWAEYHQQLNRNFDWLPRDRTRPMDFRMSRNGYEGYNFHDESDYRSDQNFYEIVAYFRASDLLGEATDNQDIDVTSFM